MSFLPNNNRANSDEDRYAAREILKAAAGVAERRDPTDPNARLHGFLDGIHRAAELALKPFAAKADLVQAILALADLAPPYVHGERRDPLEPERMAMIEALQWAKVVMEKDSKPGDSQGRKADVIRHLATIERIYELVRAIDRGGTGAEPTADERATELTKLIFARIGRALSGEAPNYCTDDGQYIRWGRVESDVRLDLADWLRGALRGAGSQPTAGLTAIAEEFIATHFASTMPFRVWVERFAGALRAGGPPEEEPRRIVDEQAKDEALWVIAENATEAYLQQELRRLHAAIEGD